MTKSIVVLSGGQDSATTLFQAQRDSEVVGAIFFDYGQKHAVEGGCAASVASIAGVPLFKTSVPSLQDIGDSALIAGAAQIDVNLSHRTVSHLPASFVPGRNLVFLTLAAAYAMKMGATQVYTGVCETDYSGYPDCRDLTISALEMALQLGMDFPDLEIVTPLMHLSKAQTFALAKDLGVLDIIIEGTHTCYEGDRETRNEWGYGCGRCPACQMRANGWDEFVAGNYDQGGATQ